MKQHGFPLPWLESKFIINVEYVYLLKNLVEYSFNTTMYTDGPIQYALVSSAYMYSLFIGVICSTIW